MRGRRKLEREEGCRVWEEHLREWKSSGLSQAEYCRKKGLNPGTFGYRKRRAEVNTVCLVEAPVQALSAPGGGLGTIRLFLDDRLRIEIDRDFDPGTLRRLMEVLGR